jgi:hypothetical protein
MIQDDFAEQFPEVGKESGVVTWAMNVGVKLGLLSEEPSKTGIAREYVNILSRDWLAPNSKNPENNEIGRALRLVRRIGEKLALPSRLADTRVLQ